MRIAFAGVAHSHPFADAANLRARGAHIAGVWDADDPARREEFAGRFSATVHASLDDLLGAGADAVVATPRTLRAVRVASACADAGVPVFVNKTVAADAAGLAAWHSLRAAPLFTSSVLRFAPALAAFAADLAGRRLLALEVHAQHDIAGFLSDDRRWQDDPAGAGGTMINIGVHAWEMLDVLLPAARTEILSATRVTGAAGALPTASELLASVHARVDGMPITVTISGASGADRYAVRAWTDQGVREVVLPDDPVGLGYGGLADAILRLAVGDAVPVAPARTAAVYGNAIAAAEAARSETGTLGTMGRIVRGEPAPDGGEGAAGSEER